jgi:hypothetical protein
MFTLRIVKKDGNAEDNFWLGQSYRFLHREWAPEEFKETYEKHHALQKGEQADELIYGIVICAGGDRQYPLSKKEWNYIMTENGATFANLSYKPVDK